jgi:hypothetical protein
MRITAAVITVAALAMSACATDPAGRHRIEPWSRIGTDGFNALLAHAPNPHFPNIHVDAQGSVVVDQEPIVIPQGENSVSIEWALASGSVYTFPENAIDIRPAQGSTGPSNLRCQRVANGKRYQCRYDRSGSAKYLYMINVTDGSRTYTSDPSIMNR